MNIDISNKVVVITGSSKGIGSELAKSFAKENARVVMNYFHSQKQAYDLHAEINAYNKNSILIRADITNHDDVSKMYHEVIDNYGRVDVLINNAGICNDNYIQLMPLEQWRKVIDVNLTSMFLCCREFSKIMVKHRHGKIINVASLKGIEGSAGQVNYSASKAGVIGLTKSLAKELGPYNVSVNAICPGFVLTDLNRCNLNKMEAAKSKSLLSIDTTLDDLVNFLIYISSNKFVGISGRIFNLDSRVL